MSVTLICPSCGALATLHRAHLSVPSMPNRLARVSAPISGNSARSGEGHSASLADDWDVRRPSLWRSFPLDGYPGPFQCGDVFDRGMTWVRDYWTMEVHRVSR